MIPEGAASNRPCAVTVRRTDATDVQQRQIYVAIDDTRATLVYGDTVTLDLEPGPHTLKANNTLYWKTVRFTATPGEHVRFVVINTAGRAAFGFLALLGVGPLALVIRREYKDGSIGS